MDHWYTHTQTHTHTHTQTNTHTHTAVCNEEISLFSNQSILCLSYTDYRSMSLMFVYTQLSEASPPISPLTSSLTSPTSPLGCGQIVMEGGWEIVKEEEGKVEGTTTPNLHLLNVDESQEGQYQCRVVYKGCTILSTAARLTILKDGKKTPLIECVCVCCGITVELELIVLILV